MKLYNILGPQTTNPKISLELLEQAFLVAFEKTIFPQNAIEVLGEPANFYCKIEVPSLTHVKIEWGTADVKLIRDSEFGGNNGEATIATGTWITTNTIAVRTKLLAWQSEIITNGLTPVRYFNKNWPLTTLFLLEHYSCTDAKVTSVFEGDDDGDDDDGYDDDDHDDN